jgi:phosphomevalonate kinase
MVRMKEQNNRHRILQQKFSKLTKVEIEPEDLRTLLDNLQHINNVVYVICPGSGGFDAICIITLDPL